MDKNYVYWRDLRTGEITTLTDVILDEESKKKGRPLSRKEHQRVLNNLTHEAQYAIVMSSASAGSMTLKTKAYQAYCQFCKSQGRTPVSRPDFDSSLVQKGEITQELIIGSNEYWVGFRLKE